MSKDAPSNFIRALRRLATATERPPVADVNALSMPTRENIAEFRAEWPRIAADRRRAIVQRMNELSEESVHSDFSDLFVPLLEDEDEYVRAEAIDGLWESESSSVARRLLRLVKEDLSNLVRAAAAEGLGHFLLRAELGQQASPTAEAIAEVLLGRIDDVLEDEEVRRRALESVAYSSADRVHEVISQAYAKGDQTMRASAVYAMGRSADTSWGDIVLRELRSRDPAMRYEAAYAAGELSVVEALPHLIELVQDSDRQVRESAVWSLGQLGGREARRVLESILAGTDESLHEAATDALAELEFAQGVAPFNLLDFEVAESGNGNGKLDEADAEDDEEIQ
jgi:HEAT repeat protein